MGIVLAVIGLICVIIPFGGIIVNLIGSALMIVGCNLLGYDWNVALVVAGLGTASAAYGKTNSQAIGKSKTGWLSVSALSR